jgi:hypothetical protein
MDIFNQVFT